MESLGLPRESVQITVGGFVTTTSYISNGRVQETTVRNQEEQWKTAATVKEIVGWLLESIPNTEEIDTYIDKTNPRDVANLRGNIKTLSEQLSRLDSLLGGSESGSDDALLMYRKKVRVAKLNQIR